jgi:hypothetical protein
MAPLINPIVPIAGLLLLHVPPTITSDNVVVAPLQILLSPFMGPGNGLTVKDLTAMHPDAIV